MKIVMTFMASSGKCASLTNATPCEQVSMCLSAYVDAINRLAKTRNMTPAEVVDMIADIIKQAKEEESDNEQRNPF